MLERINPWWVLECLRARRAPRWVLGILGYVIHLMFGRRTQHKIQARFLQPLEVNQGLAMGRATSVILFCLAFDPLIWALHDVTHFVRVRAYMDDNGTAAFYISSSPEALSPSFTPQCVHNSYRLQSEVTPPLPERHIEQSDLSCTARCVKSPARV